MVLRKAPMLIALILGVFLMVPEDAFARGGRGGGGRSWGSSRSRSSSSRSRSSSSRSNSGWGRSSSKKATSSRKMTKADKALAAKAKKNGTSFKSKADAQKAFKSKYATKYTSKYKTKPTTRPSHIPQTTMVNGKSYNVTYNVNHGGYGYMGPLGTWIMYDAMMDAVMMNTLMRNQGYYAPGMNTGVVVHSNGGAVLLWVLVSIIVGSVIVVIIAMACRL